MDILDIHLASHHFTTLRKTIAAVHCRRHSKEPYQRSVVIEQWLKGEDSSFQTMSTDQDKV